MKQKVNFKTFFQTFLRKFCEFENSVFFEKFLNFDSRTFPKLAKTKICVIGVPPIVFARIQWQT